MALVLTTPARAAPRFTPWRTQSRHPSASAGGCVPARLGAVARRLAVGAAYVCLALALLPLAACDRDVQKALDDLSGKPTADSASAATAQPPLNIPAGPHLYCITNIGHTLVLYDVAADQPQPALQRYLALDPVGPWFFGSAGFYISRVDTSGRGANALIEFDPKTAVETRRLGLGVNTNPNTLLVLPGFGGIAWIAIRGSTFNSPYGPDGIGVVNLNTMTGQIVPLTGIAGVPNAAALHSLISFVWDDACPARGGALPCVYALVNGFDGALHTGTLLVLAPDGSGNPVWLASVPLGTNPLEDMYLDAASGHLWVVNNGGFCQSCGNTGTLQAIDTTTPATAAPSPIAAGFAPTGIFGFTTTTAFVTTYPDDQVMTLDLAAMTLNATPNPALPAFTGSVLHTTLPTAQLFAGAGGFGAAHLARLDPTDGHLLDATPLQAGNGTVSCAPFTTP